MISSYSSLYALGHRVLKELFNGPVIIEEKIDGSQISFGVYGGELKIRSKGKELIVDAPEKMFNLAVEQIQHRFRKGLLIEGYTYRGEYLRSAKHNTLPYDRIPQDHIMIFDIDKGDQDYCDRDEKDHHCEHLGWECVPLLYEGHVESPEAVKLLLDKRSILGGVNIEGFVVKNYTQYSPDKKTLMAKYVSEAFKEVHDGEWRKSNPTRQDIVDRLVARYKTPARWAKAVIHLREQGEIEDSPRDIGKLVREVPADTAKEVMEEAKQILFDHFWPQISRELIKGLPEWYKKQLFAKQFDNIE